MKRIALALLTLATVFGQRPATSTFQTSIDGVIAQIVDGGTWKTFITLVNTDDSAGTYRILFYGDNGLPLVLQTTAGTGSEIQGTLGVGASLQIATNGSSQTVIQGWALVKTSNNISGQALFRAKIAGRPDFEASVPIITYVDSTHYMLPYDSFITTTSIAIVNPLSFSNMTVFLTFRDEDGTAYSIQSLTLGPLQHTAFTTWERYPVTINHRGVIDIETSGLAMGLLGLRFGTETFTSIIPLAK